MLNSVSKKTNADFIEPNTANHISQYDLSADTPAEPAKIRRMPAQSEYNLPVKPGLD